MANVLTILPIELRVHALVVGAHVPFLAKVLTLAGTATVMVIRVREPSARRVLRRWLHAPALRRRRNLQASAALWRVRTVLPDGPGALDDDDLLATVDASPCRPAPSPAWPSPRTTAPCRKSHDLAQPAAVHSGR